MSLIIMLVIMLVILILICSSLIAYIYYRIYVRKLNRIILGSKLLKETAELFNDYIKLRIDKYSDKYSALNDYINHNSVIFYKLVKNKGLALEKIKITPLENNSELPKRLSDELKICPKEYGILYDKTNILLEKIYQYNCPIKFKIYSCKRRWTRYLRLCCLKVLMCMLEVAIKVIEVIIKISEIYHSPLKLLEKKEKYINDCYKLDNDCKLNNEMVYEL